jgi:hypothetical protein
MRINVPVRLVLDVDDGSVEQIIVNIIQREGSLNVAMCPICFALVPASKLQDHMDVVVHAK